MPAFKRVYTSFPGFQVLGEIESVNTIDIEPPSSPLGAGSGVVCVVGEFERGPLNAPVRVSGSTDLATKFGGFGFEVNGARYRYPVAARSAGSDEDNAWNGNGFIALRNKRFAGLIVVRVDNSAGEVRLRRLASIETGPANFVIINGQTVSLSVDGAAPVTATFNALRGEILGASGTFPTGFTGGETLEVRVDGDPTRVVAFTAADQTIGQVVTRINSVLAADVAYDNAGELGLRSVVAGWSGRIEVVGGTALATLGLPASPVAQVSTATVVSNTGGGLFSITYERVVNGVTLTYVASYTAAGGDTVTVVRDALLASANALGIPGVTFAPVSTDQLAATGAPNVVFTAVVTSQPAPGDLTMATVPAVLTIALGSGNVRRADNVTAAEVASLLDALGGIGTRVTDAGTVRIVAETTPLTGSLEVTGGTALAALGLVAGQAATANAGPSFVIPAGTLLAGDELWVTLEDVVGDPVKAAPVTVKVRPARDDDSVPSAAPGNISQILSDIGDAFEATNLSAVARLGSAAMDVRYIQAIESTLDVSGVAHDINIIFAARASENIAKALRTNALEATATGHRARKAIVAPPLNTTVADAESNDLGVMGVGNVGREQRVFYAFPGLQTFIPEIAETGVSGGMGFTEDGVIPVRSDAFYASVASILPPEENRGQQLSDTNYGSLQAVALEPAYTKESGGVGLTIDDYKRFKAAGIVAPRVDRVAGIVFQSDITSVNPSTQPALADAKRRFMGDFVIDSTSDIAVGYAKKLNTPARRRALVATLNRFLDGLASPNLPEASRVEDFLIQDETTPEQRGQGFMVIRVAVRLYGSMDSIVFLTTVGTTVNIQELAA
jgi:hypothetical protein